MARLKKKRKPSVATAWEIYQNCRQVIRRIAEASATFIDPLIFATR